MNYTGRPSISGCRPVLSLYPTHRFCQYLLLIFITFTNSFLFNRAFSTNSRRPLRRAAGVTVPGCALSGASRQLSQRERSSTSPSRLRRDTARVAAPSVCFAAARILLAAAPTAPPCFRHWRRSSPLLPKGEALAGRFTFHWTTEARQDAKGRALLTGTAASGQRSLSSCRWPRQRSTAASEILCFARPDESWPTCQGLPLWGSWRGAERRD